MLVYPHKRGNLRHRSRVKGSGFLNKVIDSLPIELHIPGYRYCGPGTKLRKRLEEGQSGVNPLDEACKEHDIVYSENKDDLNRTAADKVLEDKAFQRFKSSKASLGEKIAALGVSAAMKAKRKLGMGLKKRRKPKKGKGLNNKRKSKKRIIPIPKKGGFLPLLFPILGALGALGGGAAGIAKAVNDAKANQEQLAELKRHNLALENTSKGKGFYLAPYKKNLK